MTGGDVAASAARVRSRVLVGRVVALAVRAIRVVSTVAVLGLGVVRTVAVAVATVGGLLLGVVLVVGR